MKVNIRRAIPSDADIIFDIKYQTWIDTYPSQEFGITVNDVHRHFEDRDARIQKYKKSLENPESNYRTWIVQVDNKAIGLGGITISENRIGALYIIPSFQGKGIGAKVMNTLLKQLDRSKDIVLDVASYNKKAIAFYENIGFTKNHNLDEGAQLKSGVIIPEIEMILKP